MPDKDMLKKASFQFNDPKVGGVQTVVRIKNRENSLLAKMQDIEFITFARSVQFARTVFNGSVALGGNGQFVRATALETSTLKHLKEYWKTDSLTEDLDISVRLLMKNWENRYLDSTAVHQEGAETFPILIRQRTRWSWGTLQALSSYVFNLRIWRSKISLRKKLDISIYLTHVTLPLVVLLCYIWSGLSFLGILELQNAFPFAFCLANAFSFIPFFVYSLWKERKDYPVRQFVPLIAIALVYTYHWIPCVTSATLKMLLCKPTWFKTPRFTKANTAKFQS
jgi:cellulose synthase/poly-beta-1,6-N-acetylglucosamine synthase-like glycosyltransferase